MELKRQYVLNNQFRTIQPMTKTAEDLHYANTDN